MAPWTGTACWDNWRRLKYQGPAAEDCLDLPVYLRKQKKERDVLLFVVCYAQAVYIIMARNNGE